MESKRPLPRGLIILGSVAVVLHLSALAVLVIAAPSGPWVSPFGDSEAAEPEFIKGLNQTFGPYYLHPLHITHNYHFMSNQPEMPQVYIEARLRDAAGKLTTLKLPDPEANYWVRHRQTLLAQALGGDQGYQPPRDSGTAENLRKLEVTLWYAPSGTTENKLQTKKEYEWRRIQQEPPGIFMFNRPSEWSQVLARSYGRYLLREHGAAKVEIVRHSRSPILPEILLPTLQAEMVQMLQQRTFTDLVCNFGEQSSGK